MVPSFFPPVQDMSDMISLTECYPIRSDNIDEMSVAEETILELKLRLILKYGTSLVRVFEFDSKGKESLIIAH